MNVSKCMYTIFSGSGRRGLSLKLRLFGEEIPYNPKPVFLALIGSLFDYSFFTVASVSITSTKSAQTVQNRAIRCIYRLKWDSPTKELFIIGLYKWVHVISPNFTMLLVEEYFSAWSAITAKMHVTSTPLGAFYSVIRIAYACIVLIRLYLTLVEKSLVPVLKERVERGNTQLVSSKPF
ncbi:hypothetical protein BpHYR1_007933 [Brachionus plicatilis]|uniref:Uncharacterized protein n=1 Tax=Brachionus plicatilis TaxID=10195 RepID=A0A3M7QF85_BRAPC|nr:hypothetical protein BpHYR1_007933 [Brachionus plicatilis]